MMALHEQSVGQTSEWYTPPRVFDALGCHFDTDAASPGKNVTPWIPASNFITRDDPQQWDGFVWLNPPFGGRNGLIPWLDKFFNHDNGICLVPDRTSAPWWQDFAPYADQLLFVRNKIKFIDAHGKPGKSPAQGTCLLALGDRGSDALRRASQTGLGAAFNTTWSRKQRRVA